MAADIGQVAYRRSWIREYGPAQSTHGVLVASLERRADEESLATAERPLSELMWELRGGGHGGRVRHEHRRDHPDVSASHDLYIGVLGLPLERLDGEYVASDQIAGCSHFGVWPLAQAAEACFGSRRWPSDVARPQVSVEFELADPGAVADGVRELRSRGFDILHEAKTEPWGQVVARLLSPEGALVGLSYAPSLHQDPDA